MADLQFAAATDFGHARECNQDSFFAAPPVFVVADKGDLDWNAGTMVVGALLCEDREGGTPIGVGRALLRQVVLGAVAGPRDAPVSRCATSCRSNQAPCPSARPTRSSTWRRTAHLWWGTGDEELPRTGVNNERGPQWR